MIKAIRATYKLDGKMQKRTFEGKGTTHRAVKAYLRSLGATKIKTKIVAKVWGVRDTYWGGKR